MALFKRLAALAGAAEAARRYARSNPGKASRYLDQAAGFVDKQTKGKYSAQIKGAADKARGAAGLPTSGGPTAPGAYGAPGPQAGTHPESTPPPGNGQAAYGQQPSPPPARPTRKDPGRGPRL